MRLKRTYFAGFPQILIPFIVCNQFITAYVMYTYPQDIPVFRKVISMFTVTSMYPDDAYPWLVNFAPVGIKGLSFAALAAW